MFLPTPGALVANRFRLRHAIGKGGMGQVWEAHDKELDGPCAVKFIVDHLAEDPEARLRMLREARAVARLRSPHVVNILSVGEHSDAMYLAMELLEGETLATRLERAAKLDAPTTLALLEQVAQVLDKAHPAGIVHRDLKPDNIWLSAEPKLFVKVLDFGIVKSTLRTGGDQTASGALMGTPQYMSPEQANGDREVDHRSDLWALAIIAMECLSGRRPFESTGLGNLLLKIMTLAPPPVHDLDPTLPASLGPWWQRALARDPNQRFQTAQDLVRVLRQGLATLAVGRGQTVIDKTERGSWLDPPVGPTPVRVQTLVTNISPTPVSSGPATAALRTDKTPRAASSATARTARTTGTSVGPVTQTAEILRPPTRRRSWPYAAGSVALAVALFGVWRTAQHPRAGNSAAESVDIHWSTLRPVATPEAAPAETPPERELPPAEDPPPAPDLPATEDTPRARDSAPSQQDAHGDGARIPELAVSGRAPRPAATPPLPRSSPRSSPSSLASSSPRPPGKAQRNDLRSSGHQSLPDAPAAQQVPQRLTHLSDSGGITSLPTAAGAKPTPTAKPTPAAKRPSKVQDADANLIERLGF